MLQVLLCVFLTNPGPFFAKPDGGRFLQKAANLRAELETKPSPEAFCRYAVFVMDYYAFQVDFRAFYFRDLQHFGELKSVRHAKDARILTQGGAMIETDLALRIQSALKHDPDNLYHRFTAAYFVWKGRGLTASFPKVMSPTEIKNIFEEGEKKGLVSAQSLYFLGLEEVRQNGGYNPAALQFLKRAHEEGSGDFAISLAYLHALMDQKNLTDALPLAQHLVEHAIDPAQKRDAFEATAKLMFLRQNYPAALAVVEKILDIEPSNPVAFVMGLDALRLAEKESYETFLETHLKKRSFSNYVGYLKSRGIASHDETFMSGFLEQIKTHDDQAWRFAMAGFWFQLKEKFTEAINAFDAAEKMIVARKPLEQGVLHRIQEEILLTKKMMQEKQGSADQK